jgi:hypothetical protein
MREYMRMYPGLKVVNRYVPYPGESLLPLSDEKLVKLVPVAKILRKQRAEETSQGNPSKSNRCEREGCDGCKPGRSQRQTFSQDALHDVV